MNRLLVAMARMTAAAGLLGLSGCPRSTPVATEPSAEIILSAPIRDDWDVYLMQGKRIGYGHVTVRHETTAHRNLLRTDSLNHLAVKREGQTTEEDIRGMSIETPQGELIRFESEVRMGPNPIRTTGRIARGASFSIRSAAERRIRPRPQFLGQPGASDRSPSSNRLRGNRCSPANAAR